MSVQPTKRKRGRPPKSVELKEVEAILKLYPQSLQVVKDRLDQGDFKAAELVINKVAAMFPKTDNEQFVIQQILPDDASNWKIVHRKSSDE